MIMGNYEIHMVRDLEFRLVVEFMDEITNETNHAIIEKDELFEFMRRNQLDGWDDEDGYFRPAKDTEGFWNLLDWMEQHEIIELYLDMRSLS